MGGRWVNPQQVTCLGSCDDLLHQKHDHQEDRDDAGEKVAREMQLGRKLSIRPGREPADRDVGCSPETAGRNGPGQEFAIAHGAHAHGEWDERVKHRQEPRHEHCDAPAPVEIGLGTHPIAFAESLPEPRGLDTRTEEAPECEADALPGERPDNHGDQQGDILWPVDDSSRRDEHDGVTGHDESHQDRGFQEHPDARDQHAQHGIDMANRVENPGEDVVHVRELSQPTSDSLLRYGRGRRSRSRRARQVARRPGSSAAEGPSIQAVTMRMPCNALSAQISQPSSAAGTTDS
jgi:hypothetical protein